jgi:hypothetical protein
MAELDKIPQKQAVEIETVKMEDSVLKNVTELNNQVANIISRFGEIYIRRNELQADLKRLDELQIQFDDEFKAKNDELREVLDALDDKYPQGRINLQDGTITYQPGAPSRKQIQQQAATPNSQGLRVVKE